MKHKTDIQVAIVGAGLSGITLALELKKQLGFENFTIYERATDVGGTWRDNYYPGCACDVPSHWYSLSTELNPNWTSKYSPQAEIQEYWKGVYNKHDLQRHMQFDSRFISAVWVEEKQGYTCDFETSNGTQFTVTCEVLISCIGGFSTPLDKPHGMKGIDDFKGERFHSARWNNSVELKGKRVGVIGNGCSATQFIPIISDDKSVEVINFSRTPSWFMPRDQKQYSAITKAIFRYIPGAMRSYRNFIAITSDSRFLVWMNKFSGIRHYVEEVSIAYMKSQAPEKYWNFLTPSYPFGCKRVILDPGYLASLNRSNVSLEIDPIDTISEKGIKLKTGREVELDVLILATGFDVSEVGLGINVTGRDGRTVTEQWKEQGGPQAYLGTCIANYPNFYQILGPNVASGSASVVYSTEAQVTFIVQMIRPMVKYGVTSFECKVDEEKKYNKYIHSRLNETVWNGGCKSYYKLGDKVIATFPGTTTEFWWRTRKPQWEHFFQYGGTRRMAVRHRLGQFFRLLLLLAGAFTVRKYGMKRVRNETVLFMLMRYQDLLGVAQRLRLTSA